MATVAQQTKVLTRHEEIYGPGDEYTKVYENGRIQIFRCVSQNSFPHPVGNRVRVNFFCSLFWGEPVSINHNGEPSWASGGTCSDATAVEIALAMQEIWRQVGLALVKYYDPVPVPTGKE